MGGGVRYLRLSEVRKRAILLRGSDYRAALKKTRAAGPSLTGLVR